MGDDSDTRAIVYVEVPQENYAEYNEDEEVLLIDVGIQSESDDDEVRLAKETLRKCQQIEGVDYEQHALGVSVEVLEEGWNEESEQLSQSDDEEISSEDEDEAMVPREKVLSDDESYIANEKVLSRHMYNPAAPFHDFEILLGFTGPVQFRECITRYAIEQRRLIKFKRNNKKECECKCIGAQGKCQWRIYASWEKEVFYVKSYRRKHSCNHTGQKNKRVTSKYLALRFKNYILNTPKLTSKQLQNHIKDEIKQDVVIPKCRRAREIVYKEVMDGYMAEFKDVWRYAEELKYSNPGTTVQVFTSTREEVGQSHFLRMYVCFDALKKGFNVGCRNYIGLDGCFLKGPLKGELLTAVGRDPNNQMFPVAWAVVEVESENSWTWFVNLLVKDLNIKNHGDGWTFMSDQQKGLLKTVRTLLPKAEQRMCCRHLHAIWRRSHKGEDLKIAFWSCAKATYFQEYARHMTVMCEVTFDGFKDMLEKDPKYWARSFFDTRSCSDCVDNNLSESFNALLVEARGKSIISMLEKIRVYIMQRLVEKKNFGHKWTSQYGPKIKKTVDRNIEFSLEWDVLHNGEEGFEIVRTRKQSEKHVVMLNKKECTCRIWQLSGIPCAHAILAINHEGNKIEDFISPWLKKERYLQVYSFMMQPVRGIDFWPISTLQPLLPPIDRALPGRKKKRFLEQGDTRGKKFKMCNQNDVGVHNNKKKTQMVSRKGRIMKCTICHQTNHNKRTCPQKKDVVDTSRLQPQPHLQSQAEPFSSPQPPEQMIRTQKKHFAGHGI